MTKGSGSPKGDGSDVVKLESKGHEATIDYSTDPAQVTVDGSPVSYGTDSSGRYYLSAYAYDRGETLEEAVQKYLGHLEASGGGRAGGAGPGE